MEAARNLLIKQNVLHGMHDQRIEAKCEFTDIARAFISIEDRFEFFLILIRPALHDPTLREFQANVREGDSIEQRRRVVLQDAFHAVTYWRSEALAIRNVPLAAAWNNANSLNGKVQIRLARTLDVHLVCRLHASLQRLYITVHFGIINQAHVKVEPLEVFRGHLRQLRHAW